VPNRAAARYYFQGLNTLHLVYLQYGDWASAQQVLDSLVKVQTPIIGHLNISWLLTYWQALGQFACVLKSYDLNDTTSANTCFAKLTELYEWLAPYMNRPSENGYQVAYRAYNALGVHKAEAQGILLALQGNFNESLQILAAANVSEIEIPYNEPPIYVRPVLQSYVNVLTRQAVLEPANKEKYLQDAVGIYQQIITSAWHNDSGFYLFELGYIYAQLGNVEQATATFRKFQGVWHSADQNLVQVQAANAYLLAVNNNVAPVSDSEHTVVILLSVFLGVIGIALIVVLALYIRKGRGDYVPIK